MLDSVNLNVFLVGEVQLAATFFNSFFFQLVLLKKYFSRDVEHLSVFLISKHNLNYAKGGCGASNL